MKNAESIKIYCLKGTISMPQEKTFITVTTGWPLFL